MSTRCNVLITDDTCGTNDGIWLYRGSDGCPNCVQITLQKFLRLVRAGKIHNNAEQAAGWMIIFGHEEDADVREQYPDLYGWKVGAYEPSMGLHADIDYFYVVNLEELTAKCYFIVDPSRFFIDEMIERAVDLFTPDLEPIPYTGSFKHSSH